MEGYTLLKTSEDVLIKNCVPGARREPAIINCISDGLSLLNERSFSIICAFREAGFIDEKC